jgi:signal transduction histidine kinase
MKECDRPMAHPHVKFLLVDDLEENLVALEALLRRDGLELLKAHSGREALELLLVHDVALALLDVQMPEMDGFELAELMRGSERTRHVPIIFLTAGGRENQRVFRGYEAGAVDFLFKPIEPHILQSKADTFFQLHLHKQQLARQLEERTEMLRLNEMLTAIVGHDLRNPLSAILSTADVLLLRSTNDNIRQGLDRIRGSGRRMSRMIDQLLDFSRVRAGGGLTLVGMEMDFLELSQRALAEHQASHASRALELEHQGDFRGVWDGDRLFQVLSNLIGNALAHGRSDVAVKLRLDGGHADRVVFSVSNGGIIPADIIEHIFDPFRSGTPRHRRGNSEGLGLGLFIVREIVRAHGGEVNVSCNAALELTTFAVSLPRRALPASG